MLKLHHQIGLGSFDKRYLRIDGNNTPIANIDWGGFNLSNVGTLEVDTQITLSDDITFIGSAANQLTITASDKVIISNDLTITGLTTIDSAKGIVGDVLIGSGRNFIWGISSTDPQYGISYYEASPDYFAFHPNGLPANPSMTIDGNSDVMILGNLDFPTSLAEITFLENAVTNTTLSARGLSMENIYTGGGWARGLLTYTNAAGEYYFQIGGAGSGQTLSRGYIGKAYNDVAITWLTTGEVGINVNPTVGIDLDINGYTRTTSLNVGTQAAVFGVGSIFSVENFKYYDNVKESQYDGYLSGNPGNITGIHNTIFGYNSGSSFTTATRNVFVGDNIAASATTSTGNVIIGNSAGTAITSAYENVGIGANVLSGLTSGNYNMAAGSYGCHSVTTGYGNIGFGAGAMLSVTTGSYNVGIGFNAGRWQTGEGGVFIGYYAGWGVNGNATTDYTTAIGYQALAGLTTGDKNVAVGYQALTLNSTGSDNTAVGYQALSSTTTGVSNTVVGSTSGGALTSGNRNTVVGSGSGNALNTGYENVFVGTAVGNVATTAYRNAGIGYSSLQANIDGNYNVAIGYSAGYTNSTGDNSLFIGNHAGYRSTASNQFFLNNSAAPLADIATEQSNSLMYGVFNATPASQTLNINAVTTISEHLTLGSGTTFKTFYSDEGDIYSENGKIYIGAGIQCVAERYGVGLQIRESAQTKTLSYDIDATFTAATATILKAGETFATDGVIVGDFIVITNANLTSYIGSTGEVTSVAETTLTISLAAAGSATPDDLTDVDFVIYNHPVAAILDNGDIHFQVGTSQDASFKILSPYGNNDHAAHVVATAGVNNHCGMNLEIDAHTYGGVSGYCLKYDATAFVAGIAGTGLNMVIDNTGATGGDFHGIDVASTDPSNTDMEVVAVGTNPGVDVIHQHLGTASVVASAWLYDSSAGTYTDVTTAFNSSGTNVQMFGGDNDKILIASTTKFDQINVLMTVLASANIKATFTFSLENTGWTAFIPSDDTSGFQNNGTIRFDSDNLTNWDMQTVNQVTGEVGATDYYWVSIRRKRNNVPTPPTESTVKVTTTGTFHSWDSTGRLGIKTFNQSAEPTVTDLPAGKFCFWTDTDDSKLYICYNHGGTVKTTEMT